jgi:hypothetical protein
MREQRYCSVCLNNIFHWWSSNSDRNYVMDHGDYYHVRCFIIWQLGIIVGMLRMERLDKKLKENCNEKIFENSDGYC